MNVVKIIVVVFAVLLLSGCAKDEVVFVEKEFEIFIDKFKEEATLRSVNIDEKLDEISIILGEIEDVSVSGTCKPNEKTIIIDSFSWNRLNFERREHLIFHELGHCVLERNFHKETKTESGDCLSFMRSNLKICSINYYSELWRSYYLAELFNEQQEIANWYGDRLVYEETVDSFESEFEILDTIVTELTIDYIEFDLLDEYLIELNFSNWNTEENTVQIRFGEIIFSSCNICQVSKIGISNKVDIGDIYYSNSEINFEEEIKLSISKEGELVHFYINEVFLHSMESKLVNGNLLETNRFDDYLELNGRILFN